MVPLAWYSADQGCLSCIQDEYISFRATSERVAEAKDGEMSRLLDTNAALREQLAHVQVKLVRIIPRSYANGCFGCGLGAFDMGRMKDSYL